MEQKKTKNADDYDIDIKACATMDCTGLIPSLPQSDAEVEAYQDLYPYLPPSDNVEDDSGKLK